MCPCTASLLSFGEEEEEEGDVGDEEDGAFSASHGRRDVPAEDAPAQPRDHLPVPDAARGLGPEGAFSVAGAPRGGHSHDEERL